MAHRPVIDYQGRFDFDVPPAELWAWLGEGERFERWWPWLQEYTLEGGGLRPGAVMRGVVVPPLPYRMRLEVELVRCQPPRSVDAIVRGDLEGDASLRLRRRGPRGSTVEAAWSVEMMQPAMRLASRVAHPVLCWGHDRVVEITVRSFRRNLVQQAVSP